MGEGYRTIRLGLLLVLVGLLFGVGCGVGFGVQEDAFKDYIAQGIAGHPQVHDAQSADKIWRYAQRAHFHATGIAAFSIGLLLLLAGSNMATSLKKLSAVLIGLGGLYPLAWFNMFLTAPAIGRSAAHAHILTEILTYVGVGGLLLGILILLANLFLGLFSQPR
jgi:hypothetical protein